MAYNSPRGDMSSSMIKFFILQIGSVISRRTHTYIGSHVLVNHVAIFYASLDVPNLYIKCVI